MFGSFRNLHISKRVIPVLVTLFFISIAFAYYYLVYVKKNEERLIQEGFRVLGHTEKNLKALKKVFITYANDKPKYPTSKDSVFTAIDECILKFPENRNSYQKPNDSIIRNSIFVYPDNADIKGSNAEKSIIEIDLTCLVGYNFIKREDVFQDFIVFSSHGIHYKTFGNQLISEELGALFPFFGIAKNTASKNELAEKLQLTQSIYTVTISNVSQQLMIYEISNFTSDNKSLYVGGLIPTALFNAKRRSLPISYIVLAVLLLVLIILLTPILKLRIMGYFEHLYISDVVSLGISFTLGIAILLVLCLAFYTLSLNNSVLDSRLFNLSHKLNINFQKELNSIYDQIKLYDSCYNDFLIDPNESYEHTIVDILSKDGLATRPYSGFNTVFWTNRKRDVKKTLSHFPKKSIEITNLKTRDYINNVIENKLWKLDSGKKVALQSIVSYADGTQELGMGITSIQSNASISVAAGSARLHSIMSPILPPGYQLAVIDNRGEVWFHSQQYLNTNENFFDEINHDPIFKSAISANIGQLRELKYHGSNQMCYVEPIGNLPLYSVAIYNLKNHRTVLSQSLAISTIVFMLFYILVLAFMIIMIISNSKLSMIKQKQFFFNWLRPIEEGPMEFRYRYFAMVNLITLTLTAALLIYIESFIQSLQLCFTVIALQILIQYESIHKVLPIVYNYFNNKRYYEGLVIILLFQFIISNIYFLIICQTSVSHWLSIGMQCMMFYLCWQFIFKNKNKDPIIVKITNTLNIINKRIYKNRSFKEAYLNFILSWSFLLGIMPAILIFMKVYTIEKNLYTKFELTEVAKMVPKKSAELSNIFGSAFNEDLKATNEFIENKIQINQYLDTLYFNYDTVPYPAKPKHNDLGKFPYYIRIKPFFNELVYKSSGFLNDNSSNDQWIAKNQSWNFSPFSKDTDFELYFSDLSNNLKNERIRVKISDYFPLVNYWIGNPWYLVFFLATIIIILFLYYKTLKYCLTMVFGWQFKHYNKCEIKTRKDINNFTNQSRRSIIISPLDYDNVVRDFTLQKEVVWTDLGNYPGIDNVAQEYVKDLDLHNITQKDFKLKLLAVKNMVEQDKKILVVSKAHPDRYHDHLRFQIESLSFDKNLTDEQRKKLIMLESELYTFQEVMSYFQIYYLPPELAQGNAAHSYLDTEFMAIPMLNTSLNKSEFKTKNSSNSDHIPYDQFILCLHQRAESLYRSIWNSLSLNEKQVVYDMAKDRFVNCKNTKSITRLMQKGIFIYDHSLRLCNESFTNFVVTDLRHNPVIHEKLSKRKVGTWGIVQNILLLVFIGILILITIGNQDLLHDVNALLVALTSALGLLFRFGGIFSTVPGNQNRSG